MGVHSDTTCSILAKFSKKNYIDTFLQGELYCNSLSYFRQAKDNFGRADKCEGRVSYRKNGGGKVSINLPGNKYFLCCFFNMPPQSINDGRAFYKTTDRERDKFSYFGDSCVVVLQPDELVKRISTECQKIGISCEWSPVEYVKKSCKDKTVSIHLNDNPDHAVFVKRKKFMVQSEFRFVFSNIPDKLITHEGAFVLNIGDIHDIAKATYDCFA